MTLGILVYALAAGMLATVAGWGLATVLRRVARPERWAWAGATALTVAATLVPFVPLASGPGEAIAAGEYRVGELPDGLVATAAGPRDASRIAALDLGARIPGAGAAWVAMSAVLLLFGVGAELRHRRRTGALRRTRMRGMDVWMSEDEGPAICGAIRPRLVLPLRIRELDARERAMILTHEAEHLRARDPQLNALAFFALIIVPWNPFLWLLRGRLARAVESDCDRRALRRRGVGARRYAELLLRVASWRLRPPPAPLRLAMSRSARELKERVARVLDPRPPRRSGLLAGVVLVGAGMAVPLFADPPRPAPADTGVGAAPESTTSERPPAGMVFRATQVEAALTLGRAPDGAGTIVGRGSFLLHPTATGAVERVETEVVAGGGEFVEAAREWLLAARVGGAPSVEPVHVWVSADSDGRWAAVRVAEALWEREGLEADPERALDLIDVWRRLQGPRGLPTVSSTLTRLDSAPVRSASFRERR